MNLYRIEFYVDTEYEYFKRECTVMADSESTARNNFREWMKTRYKDLPSQWNTEDSDSEIKVTEIEQEGFGVVFQNLFNPKRKCVCKVRPEQTAVKAKKRGGNP